MVGLGTRIFESPTSCSDYRLSLEYKRMNKQILCISLPLCAFKATFSKAWSFRSISGPRVPVLRRNLEQPGTLYAIVWAGLERVCTKPTALTLSPAHLPMRAPSPRPGGSPAGAHVARPMMPTCIMRMHESWVQIQPSASSVTLA